MGNTMQATFADFTSTFRCLMPTTPADGEEMLARFAACGNPLPPPEARSAVLRMRASRVRPPEPKSVLEQLAADGQAASRATRRLAQHDEADSLEQFAESSCSLSEDAQRSHDVVAWDAWISAYSNRCINQSALDRQLMAASNPRFVPRPWSVDVAAA